MGGYYGVSMNATRIAPFTSSGLGAWSTLSDYPAALHGLSCAGFSGTVEFVGGAHGTTYSERGVLP